MFDSAINDKISFAYSVQYLSIGIRALSKVLIERETREKSVRETREKSVKRDGRKYQQW